MEILKTKSAEFRKKIDVCKHNFCFHSTFTIRQSEKHIASLAAILKFITIKASPINPRAN